MMAHPDTTCLPRLLPETGAPARGNSLMWMVWGAIAVIGVYYLATLRGGHVWGDDFAMYIQHARNISEARPYAESGYVYNPLYPHLGPRAYPPVFPLLLAPVYRVAGLNWIALKTVGVVCFIAALVSLVLLLQHELAPLTLLALVAVLGLNPFFHDFKDQIVSDFPFFFTVLFALLLLERCHGERGWPPALAAGLSICLCTATRAAGLVLLPSFVLNEWLKARRITPAAFRVGAVAIVSTWLYLRVFSGSLSYLDQVHVTVSSIRDNLYFQLWQIYKYVWGNGFSSSLAILLTGLLGVLGALGYWSRLRRGWGLIEVFVPIYVAAVILWPTENDLRFLIPVIPFWLFYAALALGWTAKSWPRLAWVGGAALLALIAISYAGAYMHADFGPITEGVGDPRFAEMCTYVKAHTAPEATFIFEKPRLVSLLTSRRAAGYQDAIDPAQMWDYGHQIGATYWMLSRTSRRDRLYLRPFVTSHQPELELVFANSGFELYRLLDGSSPSGRRL